MVQTINTKPQYDFIDYLPLEEILKKELPPQDYLVDGLLSSRQTTLLGGKPNTFKTWFAYEIAKCVAIGKPFLDEFEVKQANVLIVDGEMGEELFHRYMKTLNVSKSPATPIFYRYTGGNGNAYRAIAEGKKDTLEYFFGEVLEFCKQHNIELVIFDSLSRIHGVDENNAQDMTRVFSHFDDFKSKGIACLIIHHERKGGNNFGGRISEALRGSYAIYASVDNDILVSRQDGSEIVTVSQTKSRGTQNQKPFKAKFHKVAEQYSEWNFAGQSESKEELFNKDKASLLQFVRENQGLNQDKLFKAVYAASNTEISRNRFLELLKSLVEEGFITKKKGSRAEQLIYTSDYLKDSTPLDAVNEEGI